MILYRKASLFDAPPGSILVHACNVQGVWGSGIAAQFHERFPESFQIYHDLCVSGKAKPGDAFILPRENEQRVGCLITSANYGQFKDTKEIILANTRKALSDIVGATMQLDCWKGAEEPIYSCKFNAGLFGVPWAETEKVMLEVFQEVGFTEDWTVCDPNL